MLRRTTLGPLESQMNSAAGSTGIPQPSKTGRQSMIGSSGRPSLGKAVRKSGAHQLASGMNQMSLQDGRSSIGASRQPSLSRRSSAYGRQSTAGGVSMGINKDPRNIRDKQWQMAAIRNLVKFATETGYDKPITPKILTAPSAKDFQHLFTFLYNKLDPGYGWKKKFEEDVMILIKCMKYPHPETITKSTLIAVGSIHAWPCLLALLIWMVELIMICEVVDSEVDSESQGASDPDRLFTEFLVRSYDQYMTGQTDYETLEEEMQENFRENQEMTLKDIEALKVEQKSLEEQLNSLTAEPSPLSQLQIAEAEITDDTKKVRKWIETLTMKQNQLNDQLEKYRSELEKLSFESDEMTKEKSRLQSIVDSQEISPADVDRMNSERDQLSKNIQIYTAKNEELSTLNWQLETTCQKHIDSVEQLASEFNSHCFKLDIIPASAPNAKGVDFECVLKTTAHRPEQILPLDMKGSIKTALMDLRGKLKDVALRKDDDTEAVNSECEQISDEIAVKLDDLKVIEDRIAESQYAFEREKENSNVELDAMNSEIESLDREIRKVKVERSRDVFDHQREVREFEIEYENLSRRYQENKDRMMKQASKIQTDIQNFKIQVHRPLEDLKMAIDRDQQMIAAECEQLDIVLGSGTSSRYASAANSRIITNVEPNDSVFLASEADAIMDTSFANKSILEEMDL